jgi:hypothetical protein
MVAKIPFGLKLPGKDVVAVDLNLKAVGTFQL